MTIRKKNKEKNYFYKLSLFVKCGLQNSSIQEKNKIPLKKWEVRESWTFRLKTTKRVTCFHLGIWTENPDNPALLG